MVSLRLRYENGRFLPLEPVQGVQDGQEITVHWDDATSPTPPEDRRAAILAMLDRTAGLWADIEGIEELMADSRQQWKVDWGERLRAWDEEKEA